MTSFWALAVARDDLSRTALVEGAVPEIGDGEALLRVDRVGLTANNVTYAVLGESFHYWDFFPPGKGWAPGWGLVPLWGFADVVASAAAGVPVGGRVYGYLPPASHLVVRPGRADARGFRDASPHRAALPSPYNVYALTTGDAAYRGDQEDLLILYRPLFFTSFMLADQLEDNDWFGAEVLVLSSASSKTAYGTAFLLHGKGPQLAGLTSAGNVAFTESLGCYDRVLPYEAAEQLSPAAATAYLDFAGQRRPPGQDPRPPGRPAGTRVGRRRHPPGAGWRAGARRPADDRLLRPRPDAQALRRLGPRGTGRAFRAGVARFRGRRRRLGQRGPPPRPRRPAGGVARSPGRPQCPPHRPRCDLLTRSADLGSMTQRRWPKT